MKRAIQYLAIPRWSKRLPNGRANPEYCAEALLECGGKGHIGFIEPVPDREGEFMIHDLFDHCPDYVQRRRSRENERQAKGKTVNELRSDAGRRGGIESGKKRQANSKQTEANDGCLLQHAKANGSKQQETAHFRLCLCALVHPLPAAQMVDRSIGRPTDQILSTLICSAKKHRRR